MFNLRDWLLVQAFVKRPPCCQQMYGTETPSHTSVDWGGTFYKRCYGQCFVAFLHFSRNGVPHLKVLLLELTTQVMGRFNWKYLTIVVQLTLSGQWRHSWLSKIKCAQKISLLRISLIYYIIRLKEATELESANLCRFAIRCLLLWSMSRQTERVLIKSGKCLDCRDVQIAEAINICFYGTGHYCGSSFQTIHLFCIFNIRHDALALISLSAGPSQFCLKCAMSLCICDILTSWLAAIKDNFSARFALAFLTSQTTTPTGHPSWHCSSPSSPSWWWSWPTTPQTLEPFQKQRSDCNDLW